MTTPDNAQKPTWHVTNPSHGTFLMCGSYCVARLNDWSPKELNVQLDAHDHLLDALRHIANYTPDSTVQPVAIARCALEKLGIPWLNAALRVKP